MTEMPRIEASRRQRVVEYALGIVSESGWILAMCVFIYLMAVGSIWFWAFWGHR
jgi:hypothetical protein